MNAGRSYSAFLSANDLAGYDYSTEMTTSQKVRIFMKSLSLGFAGVNM